MFFKKGFSIFFLIIIIIGIIYLALFFTTQNYLLPKLLKEIGIREVSEIRLSPLFDQIVFVKAKSDFFAFEKADIKFSPLPLFRRKIAIKKIVLEKLVIKLNEKKEKEKEKLIAFTLPLFLKEVEIKKIILQDLNLKKDKLELADLKIEFNLSLKEGKISAEIKEISGKFLYEQYDYPFYLYQTDLILTNEKFSLTNLNLQAKNSFFSGAVFYDLIAHEWQIKIGSSFINLKDFTNYEGQGKIWGNLIVKNGNYAGKIELFFEKAKIMKEVEDLKIFINLLAQEAFYQLAGKIYSSFFKSRGKFNLKDFSYELIGEIFNSENLLPLKIEKGHIEIRGKALTFLNFSFTLNLVNEKIDFLQGKGIYQEKKILLKEITGKGKECDFSFHGEASQDKIFLVAKIVKLPIDFLNNFIKKDLKGVVKGEGEIFYQKDYFSINGDWQVKDFSFEEKFFSFSDLNFSGDFAFSKKIDFKGKISLKKLKTPYLSMDSLIFASFFNNFQLQGFINENYLLKIDGLLFANFLDSLSFSLEDVIFIFNGNKFVNKQPLIVEIEKDIFKLKDLNLKYGEAEIVFNLEKVKDILTLDSKVKNFALDNIYSFLKKKKEISGKGNFFISLTYNFKNNNLTNFLLDTKIFDFQFRNFYLDSIMGNFSLEKETILVKDIWLFKKENGSKISGFLIIDFAKKELINQDLKIVLNNLPSEIIFFIPNILITQEGKITGNIHLQGNFKNPKMAGEINLLDCEIILKIPETKIKNASGRIIFLEREIILSPIQGKVKDGEVFAEGFISFSNFFKIETLQKDIKFKNLPINYQKDFMGVITGNVFLTLNEKDYLKIVGEAEVKEGLIAVPFGKKWDGEKKEIDSLLEMDLTFKGERNIWLRNKNADLELNIDFNLKLKNGKYTYSGKINTKQGSLYYLGRSIQLKEGEMVFENISNFDPKLNLIGFLYTKPILYQNKRERFKIILQISGYLSNPTFTISSEPPYLTEEEIISYLGLSFTPEELKNWEEKDIFLDILQDRILSYFEKETSQRLRKYIGLDYLRLESSFLGQPYLRLSVGKYLGEKFYFSYTHSFLGETQDVFQAEYFLKENQRLIGGRNELGKNVIKYLFYFHF